MAASTLEARAHVLVGQLGPDKLEALVHLMEVMVLNDEPVTDEDRHRILQGEAWFAQGKGIPMEEVLAEYGLEAEDFPLNR